MAAKQFLLLFLCVMAAAACSADGSGEFSVLAGLEQIPESSANDAGWLEVLLGDIDAAADQAGISRPADSANSDDLVDFIGPLNGFSPDGQPLRLFVPLPNRLTDSGIVRVDEFIDELGFSPGDITSFVAFKSEQEEFLVLRGVTAPADLPEVESDVSTLGEGDDFEISPPTRTTVRPLGRPLRLSQQGNQLALGLSTQMVADWVDGSGPTLADNSALAAVAERLDEEQVVSAFLLAEDANYRAVGLGWRADDRGPQGVIVLSYDTEPAAASALEAVTAGLTSGSAANEFPLTELISIEQIEVRGAEIVAIAEFPNGQPRSILDLLVRSEGPFSAE